MTPEQSAPSRAWALPLLALPFAAIILVAQRYDAFEPLAFNTPDLVALAVFGAATAVMTLWCWAVPRGPVQWSLATLLALTPWASGAVGNLLGTWSTAEAAAHLNWEDKAGHLLLGLERALTHRAFGVQLTSALLAALAISVAHGAAAAHGRALLRPTRGMVIAVALLGFIAIYPDQRAPFAAALLACVALVWVQAVARIDGDRDGLDARLVSLVLAAGGLLTAAVAGRVGVASTVHATIASANAADRTALLDSQLAGASLAQYLWFAGLLAVAFLAVALLVPLLPKAPSARERLRWPILVGGLLLVAAAGDSALQQYALKVPTEFATYATQARAPGIVLPEAPFRVDLLPVSPVWTGQGDLPAAALIDGRVVLALGAEAGVEKIEAAMAAAKDAGAGALRFVAQPQELQVPSSPEYAALRVLVGAPVGLDALVDPERLRHSAGAVVPELELDAPLPGWDVRHLILQLDETATVGELVERLAAHAARGQVVALSARREEPAVAAPAEP